MSQMERSRVVIPRSDFASAGPEVSVRGVGTPRFRADEAPPAAAANPPLLRFATVWHRARRNPAVIGLDAAIALLVSVWASGSRSAGVVATISLVAAGLFLGVWQRRTSLESQGVSWFVRPLFPAAIIAGLVVGITHSARTASFAVGAAVIALILVRAALWIVVGIGRRRGFELRRTLVIGMDHHIDQIKRRIKAFPEAGLAFEAAHVPEGAGLDSDGELESLLRFSDIRHVVCCVHDIDEMVLSDLLRFSDRRIDISLVLPFARLGANQTSAHLGDLCLIPIRHHPSWGSLTVKRAFDLTASLLLTLAASPVLLATALAIRLGDPGPAIFKQQRVGRDGRTFTIYKFRSMVTDAEARKHEVSADDIHGSLLFKVDRDPRITRVGAVIRRLSVDELPQLFNVIKGDMSLIGPRPLPVSPDAFEPAAQLRHTVLPGITGLWQVKGGNALSYADMVELDLTYIATRSLGLDLMILLRTIPAIFIRRAPY